MFADLNNDGWLDLYLNVESPQNPPPSPVSYCNRVFINQTDGTFSDDSQISGGSEILLHFGLGDATPNSVVIRWPNG